MNLDAVVEAENESIREFVRWCAASGVIHGRVLDYGCGRQPYRRLVEGVAASYEPFDRIEFPHSMAHTDVGSHPTDKVYDTILCTQVIQYVPAPDLFDWIHVLWSLLVPDGCLLMTGPTNWPDVNDLHRLTTRHAGQLCVGAGFASVECEYRAPEFDTGLPYGWWLIAHA